MSNIENKLNQLGLKLEIPKVPVGEYLDCKRIGDLLFVSGRVSELMGEVGTDVTVNEAKRNLDLLIAKVISNAEPTIITTDTGQQIDLLPLDEFNAWQETAYLLSNPANAAHLRQSIAEAQIGKIVERELIEP